MDLMPLALLRLLFPTLMYAPDEGAAGGTTTEEPSSNVTTPDTSDESGDEQAPADTGRVTFTAAQQAHIDQLIARTHGKAKTKAEADLKAWLEAEGMSAEQGANAQAQAAAAERDAARLEAVTARVEVAAERAALAAGVKPDRVARFLKLADLDVDALTDDGRPDTDAIATLIEQTLADVPEFKGTAAPPTAGGATGGDMGSGTGRKKTWTRADLATLSAAEYEQHRDEIDAQVAAGLVK